MGRRVSIIIVTMEDAVYKEEEEEEEDEHEDDGQMSEHYDSDEVLAEQLPTPWPHPT